MKILVVDDGLVRRKKLQKILQSFGDCGTAESGRAAISVFQKALNDGTPFNLITLDISMPEMDGTETLFLIREIESKKNIPKEGQTGPENGINRNACRWDFP